MIPLSDPLTHCFNCNAAPHAPLTACQQCGALLLLQHYRVVKRLGQGNSRTWWAIDQSSATQCVIQRVSQQSVIQQSVSQQSWTTPITPDRIAQLQAVGQHPQLPSVLDNFKESGSDYLVQEYIEGESLAAAIAAQKDFTSADVWQILESVLPILHWIHAHGMIHGDLKPENIIRRNPAEFALVDLGAAIAAQDRSSQRAIGSPEYAAPEQLGGAAVFASDLYSLGVVCIYLLTGVRPFHLCDATEGWTWRTYWHPNESPRLAEILDRLIEPAPSQRFASAAGAIAAIEQVRGKKITLPTPAPIVTWQNTRTFTGHDGLFASVTAVASSPDGQHVASASEDKTVRLWQADTGKQIRLLRGHSQFVQAIAFHPQQPQLLISAGRDRQIRLWNWQTSEEICTIAGHSQQIHAIAVSSDGELIASGSADKTLKLWTLDGALVSTFTGHRLSVNAVAFHPIAPSIASASTDSTICLWNLQAGKLIRTFTGHTQAVRAIAFSPTGQLLASGGEDKTIRLWDVASGQCLRRLSGHSWSISALAFATDACLISGSWDKTIKVWRVDTGDELVRLVGHTDSITSVALQASEPTRDRAIAHPNSTILISGSWDKTLKQWAISSPLGR